MDIKALFVVGWEWEGEGVHVLNYVRWNFLIKMLSFFSFKNVKIVAHKLNLKGIFVEPIFNEQIYLHPPASRQSKRTLSVK